MLNRTNNVTKNDMVRRKKTKTSNDVKQSYLRKQHVTSTTIPLKFSTNQNKSQKQRWVGANETVQASSLRKKRDFDETHKNKLKEIKQPSKNDAHLKPPDFQKQHTTLQSHTLNPSLTNEENLVSSLNDLSTNENYAYQNCVDSTAYIKTTEDENEIVTDQTFLTEVISHNKQAWVSDDNALIQEDDLSYKVIRCEVSEIESSDSEQYDTDLEEDIVEPEVEPYDSCGVLVYKEMCVAADLIPSQSVISQLSTPSVQLRHHGLGTAGAIALAEALKNNTIVTEVDLSDNYIKVEGGLSLVNLLNENCFIKKLILSDNLMLGETGIALAKMLCVNTTIETLVVKGNEFTDRVAKEFADTFKSNNTLKELDLSYNKIGEQGGLYLGVGLALNQSLQRLNLRWNSIRAKGAVSLAAALKKKNSLTDLDLSWNGISFIGCLALGKHLRNNKTLKYLDLSNNRIGTYGTLKLAPGLAHHPCIEVLKIGLNPVGDEGVIHILNAINTNTSLKLLDLKDITITYSTSQMIYNIQKTRDIVIVTGGLAGFTKGKPTPSGMNVLVQFIQDNRMRLTDLFFQWDKDKSGDISKQEFYKGLVETGLKMDKVEETFMTFHHRKSMLSKDADIKIQAQLLHLIDQIDENNDGSIDFSEIAAGRRLVMDERRFQKKVAIRTEEHEEESIKLPKIKGF